MERIKLSKIQIDTTEKKHTIIKGAMELPEEFTGNYKNSMVCPVRYNDLRDNTIYYDGNEYTLEGTQVFKNGVPIFDAGENHVELIDTDVNKDFSKSQGVSKNGSSIEYSIDGINGKITDISVEYEYILTSGRCNDRHIITLFPVTPTHYKNIKSWEITAVSATPTSRMFYSPLGDVIDINNGTCKVGSKNICNVLFEDFILSGDDNHVLYTAVNNDGYFYSNLEYYDKSWLTTDCIMLATSQDGIYYGGFKVRNGKWSIDYYTNRPVQVSYNNKVMVNQVDYAFYRDNGVYVDIKGKVYRASIENGVKLSIVDDRYIVANSPDIYENTFDLWEEKSFCRNSSYNGSVLWTLNPDNTVPVDDRKTYYVATAVNAQGQVQGSVVQGTLWPAFPVYGLADSNYQLLDIYSDTDLNVIEVYKGTDVSPTVPEFCFSLGGSRDYSGYVYPASVNLLYSAAEIDEFDNTYSGAQIVRTPYGNYITAMSNAFSMTFSYYLGTLIEVSSIFILRESIYGVTPNGYIVRLKLDNGTIASSDITTKSGVMKFMGNTQDYALFYDTAEKMIYKFDSGLRLVPYKEFSVGEALLFTCRPEDNKIAVATKDSIYVFSDDNVFTIHSSVSDISFNGKWLKAGNRAYSSYDGKEALDVEYDSGKIGSAYDTQVRLDEVDVMLDTSDVDVQPYLEYRIDVGDAVGTVREIIPDGRNVVRLKPTSTLSEGLYFRIWLRTNANLMGVSVMSNAFNKPNLTRNNG